MFRKEKAGKASATMATTLPPLLRLPSELRNAIYIYSIIEQSPIVVDDTQPLEPALLSACRTIRDEALFLFYADNTFELRTEDFNSDLDHKFINRLRRLADRYCWGEWLLKILYRVIYN